MARPRVLLSLALMAALSAPLSWLSVEAQNSRTQPVALTPASASVSLNYMPATLLPYEAALGEDDARTPLILVHGIGGTQSGKYQEWDEFLDYATQRGKLHERFRIYLYHYDSARPVPKLSEELALSLKHLLAELPSEQNIRILAYSEGGLLVRKALQQPLLNERTEKVLTIATPFQGSPLAERTAFSGQVRQENLLSPLRLSHKIAYRVAGKRFPTFEADFNWDESLGALAEDVTFGADEPDYLMASHRNFIAYGSFFGPAAQADNSLAQTLGVSALPKENRQPKLFAVKNIVFSLINKTISKFAFVIPHAKTGPGTGTPEQQALTASNTELPESLETAAKATPAPNTMMFYNDGISPISSSLWLGRFLSVKNENKLTPEQLWAVLGTLKGTQTARLFPAMDHHNWIDGNSRTQSDLIPDLLNPNETPKTAFDWILHDLMS